jgi:hypothetical protein
MRFFRNDAQDRIAVVLERCVNTWLGAKNRGMQGSMVVRLEQLKSDVSDEEARSVIQKWFEMFQRYPDILGASGRVKGLVTRCTRVISEPIHLERFCEEVSRETQEGECASIVFQYVQQARSQESAEGHDRFFFAVEWAMTAKAVIEVGNFRRMMITDARLP